MEIIPSLTELFRRFPGIGPRQAKRFVYFLLSQDKRYLAELADLIHKLPTVTKTCSWCHRFTTTLSNDRCALCADETRDTSLLMLVEKDVDLETIERSGGYRGFYFVLGGSLPILEKEPEKRIRLRELRSRLKAATAIKELIFALSVTPEGEHTREYLAEMLSKQKAAPVLSTLGRGLSTGSELEYADSETIKSALSNRK